MITLIITQGRDTVAVIDEWDGPVPEVGHYMYHPDRPEPKIGGAIAGCVAQVVWGIFSRPRENRPAYFVKSGAPFVEVVLR